MVNATALTLVVILSVACGANAPRRLSASSSVSAFTSQCILPNGSQDNSLQGHWLTADLPLKISFHTGSSWSGAELSYMTAAADSWNAFFNRSKGGNIFNYGDSGAPNTSSYSQTRPDCAQVQSTDGTVVYKRGVWSAGSSIIALTSYCSRPVADSGIRIMYNAILEMNYQHFFASGVGRYPDLQSIALHELGHLLGLDHSCGPTNSGGSNVDCPTGADELGLRATVMFPDWSFDSSGTGESKRVLTENDQGRANCLY